MQNIATDNDCHIKKKHSVHTDAYEILVESRDQSTRRSLPNALQATVSFPFSALRVTHFSCWLADPTYLKSHYLPTSQFFSLYHCLVLSNHGT